MGHSHLKNKKLYFEHSRANNVAVQNVIVPKNIITNNVPNFYEYFNSTNNIIIHCPGKVGEILAATSVAKYIKINCPTKHIKWICSKLYKKVLDFCPYVDEIEFHDANYNDENIHNLLMNSFHYAMSFNKKQISFWMENNVLNLNPYFEYVVNSRGEYPNIPFNEQMFNCIHQPYNIRYQPDIVYYPKYEQEAKYIKEELGKFIIILPYGNTELEPLSFMNKIEELAIELKQKDINILITGNNYYSSKYNFNFCYNYPDLELGTLFSLFRRSSCVIGINSGIVFSSLFLRAPNIIMEDARQIFAWNINNIKLDYKPNLLSARYITIQDILSFLQRVGV